MEILCNKKLVAALVLGTVALSLVNGQTAERRTIDDLIDEERILAVEEYREPWITGDSNNDGRIDYGLLRDDRGRKKREAMDHNNDGVMDNFLYYRNGVLLRQEIDSNYNGQIDLVVVMFDAVRVKGYERDTNHDGTFDLVRDFEDS